MSLYVFALDGAEGIPDQNLLSLLCARISFNKIFCAPDCLAEGEKLSISLNVPLENRLFLSGIYQNETEREFGLRINREKNTLLQSEKNNIVLLSLNTAKVFCLLKHIPTPGYSEVI